MSDQPPRFLDFIEVRRDGQLVPEGTPLEAVFAMGGPERVVELRWKHCGEAFSLQGDGGLLARLLPGRELLLVILHRPEGDCLIAVLPDGSEVWRIPPPRLRGQLYRFGWFEGCEPGWVEIVLMGEHNRRVRFDPFIGEGLGDWESR